MADEHDPKGLNPVPGSASGRGRIGVGWGELTSTVLDRPTRRRAGVFRRALRREASRLRDPRRIIAIVLLSLTFSILARRDDRARRAGRRRCTRVLGGRPAVDQRRQPVRADRALPAVRLRAVDAAAVRALGAAAVGRGLVRVAGRRRSSRSCGRSTGRTAGGRSRPRRSSRSSRSRSGQTSIPATSTCS